MRTLYGVSFLQAAFQRVSWMTGRSKLLHCEEEQKGYQREVINRPPPAIDLIANALNPQIPVVANFIKEVVINVSLRWRGVTKANPTRF
jgi:hypothetical protein